MGLLDAPIVDGLLELAKEWLEDRQSERRDRQSQREFVLELIEKTKNRELVDQLIQQHIDLTEQDLKRGEHRLENASWWQERARALGDILDGDAWERLAELLRQAGIELPEEPPAPPAT